MVAGRRLREVLKQMVTRYLPSEIAGTITALAAAGLAYAASDSLVAAAVAGSLGEGIGFYGITGLREFEQYYLHHYGQKRLRRAWLTAYHALRGMMVEYGPAETLDSVFVRPFLFYAIPRATGSTWLGWIAAKLGADIFFYIFVAVGYKLRQHSGLDVVRKEKH